jgi:PleD family two-component response regulator
MSGVDALLRSADLALQQAKADGRDRIAVWTPPPVPEVAAE